MVYCPCRKQEFKHHISEMSVYFSAIKVQWHGFKFKLEKNPWFVGKEPLTCPPFSAGPDRQLGVCLRPLQNCCLYQTTAEKRALQRTALLCIITTHCVPPFVIPQKACQTNALCLFYNIILIRKGSFQSQSSNYGFLLSSYKGKWRCFNRLIRVVLFISISSFSSFFLLTKISHIHPPRSI